MAKRVLFLLKTYLLTVVIFVAAKIVFMLCNGADHPVTFSDMCEVIHHGLSLDLSTSLYILSVPFLLMIVSVWTGFTRWLRIILLSFFAIISLALTLAFVADTSLYPFWGFKLDASCLQYLETPTEAMASVTTAYLIWRVIVIIAVTLLFFFGYKYIVRTLRTKNTTGTIAKVRETIFYLICIPLIIIGIRGGLGESTTNIGQVYYSQNQFLNHSAVNPVFSFFASFEKTATNNVSYHFMDDSECVKIISRLYNTDSTENDTLLTTQAPNIVIILLESLGGTFTEIGGRDDVTPNLNRLAHEGIYFTNCYGNTWRTDRGTVCTWSGYPSFPTMSVMKIPSKSQSLPNIARTLSNERNYHTHYLYGGDINFTNMRSYLVSGGFQQLTWSQDYSTDEQKSARWGVRDDITFGTLYDLCTTLPQPFLIGFSTLSSHAPWDVPINKFEDEILNAFYYLDQCVGNFIKKLRQSPVWNNTLIIMLPDHGIPYKNIDETNPLKNHIPMIWTGGAVKAPQHIEQICNQTDLPATLLGQMGISHKDFTFSRDVMSESYTNPIAINTYDDGFSIYDDSNFVNYDFISNRVVASQGKEQERMILQAKAILQAASKDLDQR
ncbi:MAG: sulfatase-like hydrolase/transferase [Prevotella sp.]|nr:sulfatase-like hydrolase/transferase [Prevotella sp.]